MDQHYIVMEVLYIFQFNKNYTILTQNEMKVIKLSYFHYFMKIIIISPVKAILNFNFFVLYMTDINH